MSLAGERIAAAGEGRTVNRDWANNVTNKHIVDLMSALVLHDQIRSLQPPLNLSPSRCQHSICEFFLRKQVA